MTTSTSSAAATGLPDRRRLLSAFAAAGALGLPAIPAIASPAGHSDAELIALAADLAAAEALCDDLGMRCDEAFDLHVDPPIPAELLWQPRDFPSVWVDKTLLDGIVRDGKERYTFACPDVLPKLRTQLASWRATPEAERFAFSDRDVARVEEIVARLEAWEAEQQRRLDAGGQNAASDAFRRQSNHVDALRRRLAVMPAATAEGVRIKVWAARKAGIGPLRQELDDLLDLPELRRDQPREMLLLSAMIDVDHLGSPASSSTRSVA